MKNNYSLCVEEINELAKTDPKRLISESEKKYNDQLDRICEEIISNRKIKIVLISGPSGSGKTTSSNKIKERLQNKGIDAISISLDDFFKNKSDLPILENGEKDYESVNTLDIEEIRKCFGNLLGGKEAVVPYFDFIKGMRDKSKERKIEAKENSVILVEGLHAINKRLTDGIDAFSDKVFYKIYISPESQIKTADGTIILRRRSIRMMRRMIRDYLFRGSSFENTLYMWEGVCREEFKTIVSYQEIADIIIDSTHFYEPCMYHHFIFPILEKSEFKEQSHKETIADIISNLGLFYDLTPDIIPENSLIREFIGEA